MIRIAVVDDELKICAHIESCMESLSKKYNEKIEVEPYTESMSFLRGIRENNEVFDLIFLDIELDDKSGIEIAEYIRYKMQDELQQIVYISGKSTYSLALHDTHPLDFLIKPIQESKLEKILVKFMKISGLWSDLFSYKCSGVLTKVKISDIRYFSVLNKDIMIHTNFNEDLFHGSLADIERELRKYDFLYIHRSYLVNPVYIKLFEYDKVILLDDTSLPIGSSKRPEICKKRILLQKKRQEEDG